MDPLTSTLDSTLLGGALEAAGEEARDKEEEEEEAQEGRGEGGRGALLPASLAVTLTPAAYPARGRREAGKVGERGPRTMGAPRPPAFSPNSSTPLGRSVLGLFHWRTLPKMVICVRGRECGFPRLRVTWRERDSLACSRVRPGLPTSSLPSPTKRKGRGAGPRKRPRRPRLWVLEKEKKNRSPEN